MNLVYYKFLLDNLEESFGSTTMHFSSHQLADEVDAVLDIAATNWWLMTVEFTLPVPNTAFREATGGNATWINSMLYTNFNF